MSDTSDDLGTRRDLMHQEEIRQAVRRAYGRLPTGAGRAVVERFYAPAALEALPVAAVDWALGVGDPVRHAGLRPGEVVLDVGCGGGIDALLAAERVGPDGHVVGLDTLSEMCERARAAAATAGLADRCTFLEGEMERIPLPDGAVDVVLSNGVVNLSPRKSRALAELARVLAPGGRLCLTDLTVDGDLPPEVLVSEAAWAGCLSGALSERVFVRKLAKAGFAGIEVADHTPFGLEDVALYPLFTRELLDLLRRTLSPAERARVAVGVRVRATAPGG